MCLLGGALSVCGWIGAGSADAQQTAFSFTAAEQSFTVPSGVTSIQVTAIGAPGSASGGFGHSDGASVTGNISVSPGEVLYIEVGGPGTASAGGFNGGGTPATTSFASNPAGGGGGASDVRTCSASVCALSGADTRLIVAGGGGGTGGNCGTNCGANPGDGGNADSDGTQDQNGNSNPGLAATTSAGGTGGSAPSPIAGNVVGAGGVGSIGQGGAGGSGNANANYGDAGGGGGGGGVYGGGGASGSEGASSSGGGGGSSLAPAGGTVTTAATGTPSVTFTYTIPTYALTVAKAGNGTGGVTSTPGGISCGKTCSHAFQVGTAVKLTAKAASGSRFTGWSGACSGTATCNVTMNAAETVTARFTKIIPPPNTIITGTKINSVKRKAMFDFTGSGGVGALHFECKLDSGSWQSCTSPRVYTALAPKTHTFQVRAIDSRREADPTPAKLTFTI